MIIFGSCECELEPLAEVLGNPCYVNEDENIIQISENSEDFEDRNLGICSTGKTKKDGLRKK
jgi:hypothetical protein